MFESLKENFNMSNKAKGSRTERELIKLFTEHSWRAVRVAGSGVNDDSPCDLIVGKNARKGYTIEAKSSKKTLIYISNEQMHDFIMFTNMIGLRPVIAVRFNYEGWLFLDPKHLKSTDKAWGVSLKLAKEKGKRFSQYFEKERSKEEETSDVEENIKMFEEMLKREAHH
jgi:Holliday junction resolvase